MSPAEPLTDPVLDAQLLVADAIGDIIEHWGFRRGLGRVWTVLFLDGRRAAGRRHRRAAVDVGRAR